MNQAITSAATSQSQIPALHRRVFGLEIIQGATILDYGCGKYDKGRDFLLKNGAAEVLSYDPFNRTDEENDYAKQNVHKTTLLLCANVLNVVKADSRTIIASTLATISKRTGCAVYISVYEGDRSGWCRETTKGFQAHLRASAYESLLRSFFSKVTRSGNTFICEITMAQRNR